MYLSIFLISVLNITIYVSINLSIYHLSLFTCLHMDMWWRPPQKINPPPTAQNPELVREEAKHRTIWKVNGDGKTHTDHVSP